MYSRLLLAEPIPKLILEYDTPHHRAGLYLNTMMFEMDGHRQQSQMYLLGKDVLSGIKVHLG